MGFLKMKTNQMFVFLFEYLPRTKFTSKMYSLVFIFIINELITISLVYLDKNAIHGHSEHV